MLLDGDKQATSQADVDAAVLVDIAGEVDADHPPSYSIAGPSTQPTVTSPSQSDAGLGPSLRPPPNVKAVNFLTLIREPSAIRETFVVDPDLIIPRAFLAPRPRPDSDSSPDGDANSDADPDAEGQTAPAAARKNLHVESRYGLVDAEIWLVKPRAPREKQERATMEVRSMNGKVTVKLRRADCAASGRAPHPVALTAVSEYGAVSVTIPRNFRGPVSITTARGDALLSPGISAQLTVFAEENGTRRGFLGDFNSTNTEDGADGMTDELVVESTHGTLSVRFEDEELHDTGAAKAAAGAPGTAKEFFGRVFGW